MGADLHSDEAWMAACRHGLRADDEAGGCVPKHLSRAAD